MTIEFTRTDADRRRCPTRSATSCSRSPGFGRVFTDHMVTITWTPDEGWHNANLRPYGPLALDPATAVFHYGQSIFEGFKAYVQPDGSIKTFRPDANGRRFQRSARRLALPELPVDDFVAAADLLIEADRAWVPAEEEKSLYLRPFMMATEAFLGVRPANHVTFMVIASPAGAYFAGGLHPVSIWLSEEYTRAAPGGTGAAKCAGNYAASLVAQQEASANGCDQVVFLDAVEKRWVEELGGMNVYFVFDDGTLVTPPVSGTILEGVTRDAILTIAAEHGHATRAAADRHRRVAGRRRVGPHHRGVRLRHRGGGHPARPAGLARRRAHDGRRRHRQGHPRHPRLAARHPVRPRRPTPHGWMHPVC